MCGRCAATLRTENVSVISVETLDTQGGLAVFYPLEGTNDNDLVDV